MNDIYLYAGHANPNDIILSAPGVLRAVAAVATAAGGGRRHDDVYYREHDDEDLRLVGVLLNWLTRL